jgi:cell shape-determining protein MreC
MKKIALLRSFILFSGHKAFMPHIKCKMGDGCSMYEGKVRSIRSFVGKLEENRPF